jgi:DNA-directed RNA polymerase beta' subunit
MSSIYQELSYHKEIDQIIAIKFGISDPEVIKRISVVEITKTDTYVGTEPVDNGLFDSKMGVIEHNRVCKTCLQKNTFCPGHFGHITLAKPVFYIQFFDIVKKILKCVCFRCHRLLIDRDGPEVKAIIASKMSKQKKWEKIYKMCQKVKICGNDTTYGCGSKQPDKILREPLVKIVMEWKDIEPPNNRLVFDAEKIMIILRGISDADSKTLGFDPQYNRPEWMICTVLPVPPPSVRPSVRTDTGQRSEDDLTHKLCDIVKTNNNCRMKIETDKNNEQIELAVQVIQYHVATLIDNNTPGISPAQQRTGRVLKSLTERLKAKEGRIRGNLMGKRVDFSARSVITPDPCISIDELGVPVKIAMNLTFPEYCNKHNFDVLNEYVTNGPDKYPGAKYLKKTGENMRTIRLRNADRSRIKLEIGDIVERHLMDSDTVLFNRQPSLHRMSMLGHRVKVMPYNTFRLNPCVCNPYNADFDGDEMNMHVPQSLNTMNEIIELAAVPQQIISPRECKPIVSVVQDVSLGIYLITQDDVRVNEKQYYNLLAQNSKFIGILAKPQENNGLIKKWSGRQLLTSVIPKNISLKTPNRNSDGPNDNKNNVLIENGEIVRGIFDKSIYQNQTKGLVHTIYNECGPDDTRHFFDNTQKLICNWLVLNGYSVGISDLVIDKSVILSMKNRINQMKMEVYDILKQIHENKYDKSEVAQKNLNDHIEIVINKKLNQSMTDVGKKALDNETDNRLISMILSGSKGSAINISQMVACLGQQNVDGKRISYGFESRTLPHFTKYDDGPSSRGFVENNFMSGLTPSEFFFHSMGGREGLIDTAVKSVTGDTPIIILENNIAKYVKIGDWIDNYLNKYGDKVKHFTERQMELLYIDSCFESISDNKVFIPTTDKDGNVTWGDLTAVTRHDPGDELYQIKTLGGRSVIVTESKSLLTWNKKLNEFVDVLTPEIKIGDFVPVTGKLMEPPIIVTHVNMEEYFPKTEYIYGTDFHLANKMVKEAMQNRIQIPRGWWEKHNGQKFTLPYTKKSNLTRACSGRSNIDNIKTGGIYPYHANREGGFVPDKFILNIENGIFIGLFLSEGHANNRDGIVSITNTDSTIKSFVKKWFDNYRITHKENTRVNKYGGTSSGVIGYSSLLARFLDKFVGNGAHNKYIPNVAFIAPDEFIIGILNGYFSGDGSVSENSISSGSASSRLTEGISMLLSRLGIFCKLFTTQIKENNFKTVKIAPSYRLSIRAQWAKLFYEKIGLLLPSKHKQLEKMVSSKTHRNFDSHNDVVLDKIIEIKIIDIKDYPKVYDVTVPSTLNFGLANGLQVRDTSETGYIQRKLVKAMEDCKVSYDYSVRNAAGSIVQFLYGEDGMDSIKIESQNLEYIHCDYITLQNVYLLNEFDNLEYLLTPETIEKFKSNKNWQDKMKSHFDKIVSDREFMIEKIFKYEQEINIKYPVAIRRIIDITRNTYNKYTQGVMSNLDPIYVLDTINRLELELIIHKHNPANKLFMILINCFLSPKRVLTEWKFSREAFDQLISTIKLRFFESMAHPSEMVGVIAAQSIGEPCTQMTLNSVEWNTKILLYQDGRLYDTSIGKYIDEYLENIRVKDLENHPNDTELGWIRDKDVKILSCDKNGKITWQKVEAVTRHPPINKDGSHTLLKVTTRSKRTVIATKAKSFLRRVNNQIEQVYGSDIKIGDYLPVSKILPVKGKIVSILDVGIYLSKKEYIFMTEVEKAIECSKRHRQWWKKWKGIEFEVPHSRSDTFRDTFINKKQKQEFVEGCVYPKKTTRTISEIPEKIKLDTDFGFFVGAYLAEGHVTDTHVLISNVDERFLEIIRRNCARFSINYHMDIQNINGGVSKTLRMHSTVLARLFENAFGKGSANKKIPAWVLAAPDRFVGGLMNGYFSGDGTLGKIDMEVTNRNSISSTSISYDMLESLQQILLRYDITSWITFHDSKKYSAKYAKFDSVRDAYKIHISCKNTKKFADVFSFVLKCKDLKLNKMIDFKAYHEYGRYDVVPEITLSTGSISCHRDKIPKLIENNYNDDASSRDRKILENILQEDILYDEVVSIDEVESSHKFVYDLTVENTRNFNVYNGLAMADTFHLSGVSEASKAVRGVPRIRELLSVTKNIKAPVMTIYIKDKHIKQDKKACNEILNTIKTTHFSDIVKSTQIYYDPDDNSSDIDKDQFFIDTYKAFADNININTDDLSPWLLRFEFKREMMLEHGVTMMDVNYTLSEYYNLEADQKTNSLQLLFSDDNADKLVLRIRLAEGGEDRDMITELKALEKTIMDIIITGINNVTSVFMRKKECKLYDSNSMTFQDTLEWVLETNGTNLLDMLSHDKIDKTKTTSNDINEIYNLFGIEAARQALFNEISDVIKLADLYVNSRHIALLVDTMTRGGYMLSVDRHGINRGDIGPLAKCSFEETTDMLVKAGIFADIDKINGVSANIMLGQCPKAGTGDSYILIDQDKLIATDTVYEASPKMENKVVEITESDLYFDFTPPLQEEIENMWIPEVVLSY